MRSKVCEWVSGAAKGALINMVVGAIEGVWVGVVFGAVEGVWVDESAEGMLVGRAFSIGCVVEVVRWQICGGGCVEEGGCGMEGSM